MKRNYPDGVPYNGNNETIGNLYGPWLEGLSTTPSSTFPFEKSMDAEATLVVEKKMYSLE